MPSVEKNVVTLLIGTTALYSLYSQPFMTVVLTFGIAGLLFSYTKSRELALIVLLGGLALRGFDRLFAAPEPVGIEAFQVKDPVSVHERIATVKQPQPLQPKVETVTGVLESPSILDNVPLSPMQELTSDAQPGASIPASAKARVLIYPPPENFVDAAGQSKDKQPKENPYLQNGPDDEGAEVAMMDKGTDLPPPEVASANVPATVPGEAPAF